MSRWLKQFAQKVAIALALRNDAQADQSEGNLTFLPLQTDSQGNLRITGSVTATSSPPKAATFTTETAISIPALGGTGVNGATQLVAANANRNELVVTNNGTKNMYVGDTNVVAGNAVAATGGILLSPGGSYDTTIYTGALFAITAAGDTTVAGVLEV